MTRPSLPLPNTPIDRPVDRDAVGAPVQVFGDDGQARRPGTIAELDSWSGTITIERERGPRLILTFRPAADNPAPWLGCSGCSGAGQRFRLFWA